MTRSAFRFCLWMLIFYLLISPLFFPFITLFRADFSIFTDQSQRLLLLLSNTVSLVGLTLLFTIPLGTLLAIFLYRVGLPSRMLFRFLLLSGLFIPLPIFVTAWQIALGPGGWLISGPWKPWGEGLFPAAFIHSLASLPWVVWLIGNALIRFEPELEEDALTMTNSWGVLRRVILPRIVPILVITLFWIGLQTANEIVVTDVTLVRTFAEEVYTQYVLDRDALPQIVLLSLPFILILSLVAIRSLKLVGKSSVTLLNVPTSTRLIHLRAVSKWICFILILISIALYLGLPILSLLWKSGSEHFSLELIWRNVGIVFSSQPGLVWDSLLWSLIAGLFATLFALLIGRKAIDSKWIFRLLLFLVITLWAIPSPVLGFGLKESIDFLLDLEETLFGWQEFLPLRTWLYDQPSLIPVLWCHIVKFFPYAIVIVLITMRSIPQHLFEAARIDGATRWVEFRLLTWPLGRNYLLLSVLVVMLFSLAEISASKLVEVPGRSTFAQELFRQMHYGTAPTVASFCLMQIFFTAILTVVIFWLANRTKLSIPE
jgi:iron(III) transport system permease protein